MKHFLFFLALVFLALFYALYSKNSSNSGVGNTAQLKVYASSSFISKFGPGPLIKDSFQQICQCRIEYFDSADSTTLIQRLKTEPRSQSADVVLGFDQFDLELAQKGFEWKPIPFQKNKLVDSLQNILARSMLVPYDWGVISFVGRTSQVPKPPTQFQDLLNPEFRDQISIQDPRTSSLGFQLLSWLIQSMGEEKAFQYLEKLNTQVKAIGTSWSMSYGLFEKKQVLLTLSYSTSPMYHLIEEKNEDILAYEFKEGHPIQLEYIGIPATCRNCDLAEKFVLFILSLEGQKIIMEKNYMLPVLKGVKENSSFSKVASFKILENFVLPSSPEKERVLKRWAQLRRFQ